MKKLFIFVGFAGFINAQNAVDLTLSANTFEPLNIVCATAPAQSKALEPIIRYGIAPLLQATKQFKITHLEQDAPHTKQELSAHAQTGFSLALYFAGTPQSIDWRLFDTLGAQQLKGKKITPNSLSTTETAIMAADQVWQELVNQQSSFLSLIAACKQEPGKSKKRMRSSIYLMHPFLPQSSFKYQPLVTDGNNIAPRWHPSKATLFYSHHRPTNVCLKAIDRYKNSWTISSFDGQNLTPTISSSGKTILVISGGTHTKLYEYLRDPKTKKHAFVCITIQEGDFISPHFINDHELVFCHIGTNNVPKLGMLNTNNHQISWLGLGAALCPCVSPNGEQIAFCKKINGIYQLFTYDLKTQKERQITHGKEDADECSWSPCGNFIACSLETDHTSRIAIVDANTGVVRYLTPTGEHWSYPRWSPRLTLPFGF